MSVRPPLALWEFSIWFKSILVRGNQVMKGLFVCPAACELLNRTRHHSAHLFVYSIRTGKRRRGGLARKLLGEEEKKSHSCQLAVLSGSGLKLKAKDSSPVEGKKKVENYQNRWKLLKIIMDKSVICPYWLQCPSSESWVSTICLLKASGK